MQTLSFSLIFWLSCLARSILLHANTLKTVFEMFVGMVMRPIGRICLILDREWCASPTPSLVSSVLQSSIFLAHDCYQVNLCSCSKVACPSVNIFLAHDCHQVNLCSCSRVAYLCRMCVESYSDIQWILLFSAHIHLPCWGVHSTTGVWGSSGFFSESQVASWLETWNNAEE